MFKKVLIVSAFLVGGISSFSFASNLSCPSIDSLKNQGISTDNQLCSSLGKGSLKGWEALTFSASGCGDTGFSANLSKLSNVYLPGPLYSPQPNGKGLKNTAGYLLCEYSLSGGNVSGSVIIQTSSGIDFYTPVHNDNWAPGVTPGWTNSSSRNHGLVCNTPNSESGCSVTVSLPN